jgi:hypothetical protein
MSSISVYYGIEIPAKDFDHLIITTEDHDSLPLEVDVWSTYYPIDHNPQELLQEDDPLYVDDSSIIIFNPPPTQLSRQANVVIGVEVTTLNSDQNSDPRSNLLQWSNFDSSDKSQIDDMIALICIDLQIPTIQQPKYITLPTTTPPPQQQQEESNDNTDTDPDPDPDPEL